VRDETQEWGTNCWNNSTGRGKTFSGGAGRLKKNTMGKVYLQAFIYFIFTRKTFYIRA
jgi:hypothetical protein